MTDGFLKEDLPKEKAHEKSRARKGDLKEKLRDHEVPKSIAFCCQCSSTGNLLPSGPIVPPKVLPNPAFIGLIR